MFRLSSRHFSLTLSSGSMLKRNSSMLFSEMSTTGFMISSATLPSPILFTG